MSELALLVATDERLSGEVAAARAEVTQLADSQPSAARYLLPKNPVRPSREMFGAAGAHLRPFLVPRFRWL